MMATWCALLGALSGFAMTIRFGSAFSRFGGLEYLPRLIWLSVVREWGASVATSAAVLALVTWAHRFDLDHLERCLRSVLLRGFFAAFVALPLVTLVALATSFVTGLGVYGIDWRTFSSASMQPLRPMDWVVGLESATIGATFTALTAWLFLPLLARSGWRLPAKLAVTWLWLVASRGFLSIADGVLT